MTEVKGVRRKRRRILVLVDLRDKRHLNVKEKKVETTVYHKNIRKKYKLFYINPWTCLQAAHLIKTTIGISLKFI